jgi:hypothetical protein
MSSTTSQLLFRLHRPLVILLCAFHFLLFFFHPIVSSEGSSCLVSGMREDHLYVPMCWIVKVFTREFNIWSFLHHQQNVVQLAMLLWCYFAVVFTDPGRVPQGWRPSSSEDDLEVQSLPLDQTPETMTVAVSVPNMAQSARIRYCRKCSQYKPPRSHHCSVCKNCSPFFVLFCATVPF